MSVVERLAHTEALLHEYVAECLHLRERVTELQARCTELELERRTDETGGSKLR